jgi:hypothetical protein
MSVTGVTVGAGGTVGANVGLAVAVGMSVIVGMSGVGEGGTGVPEGDEDVAGVKAGTLVGKRVEVVAEVVEARVGEAGAEVAVSGIVVAMKTGALPGATCTTAPAERSIVVWSVLSLSAPSVTPIVISPASPRVMVK